MRASLGLALVLAMVMPVRAADKPVAKDGSGARPSEISAAERTATYIDDLRKRMEFEFAQARKKETAIKRDEASAKATKMFVDEVAREQMEFWWRIDDISKAGKLYRLRITGPLDTLSTKSDSPALGSYDMNLSDSEAKRVRPGDYLVLRGKAMLFGYPRDARRQQSLIAVFAVNPDDGPLIRWSLFLEKPTPKIEHVRTSQAAP
jgi:hypothetical protein